MNRIDPTSLISLMYATSWHGIPIRKEFKPHLLERAGDDVSRMAKAEAKRQRKNSSRSKEAAK